MSGRDGSPQNTKSPRRGFEFLKSEKAKEETMRLQRFTGTRQSSGWANKSQPIESTGSGLWDGGDGSNRSDTTLTSESEASDRERISTSDIRQLLEEQGYRCALTGVELTPEIASLDHKTPLSKGGAHSKANCQVLHIEVNRSKGAMSNEEFLAMCRAVVCHNG